MIKKLCQFGFDTITTSVLERPSKNGVKSVDQRSPPVKSVKKVFDFLKVMQKLIDYDRME